MAKKQMPRSEGDELESFLNELEKDSRVREIAGWDCGFSNFNRALNGILPGLYLLIGRPGCGKTSFAKQLLDQVAMNNTVPAIFFSFAETRNELRIRTLARLSGLENREIRRGSAYLLHWYGMPKGQHTEVDRLPPSWQKLRNSAAEARRWLDLTYLLECGCNTTWTELEDQIREIQNLKNAEKILVVIDDGQRQGASDQPLQGRLVRIVEQLQETALRLNLALLATWPDLGAEGESMPQTWAERVPSADAIFVIERDLDRTKKLIEPNQAITLHVVKNRGGERGKLAFDFYPAFCKFLEVTDS